MHINVAGQCLDWRKHLSTNDYYYSCYYCSRLWCIYSAGAVSGVSSDGHVFYTQPVHQLLTPMLSLLTCL